MNSRRRVNSTVGCYLTMKHLLALTFSSLLVVVSCPVSDTHAHGGSQKVRRAISGRITDLTGAVVVGAMITIVGRSSHTTLVKKSNAEGQYVADLEPDTYDVVAAASGFKTATQRSTRVSRGSRSYFDFVLYPGDTVSPRVIQDATQQSVRRKRRGRVS
jgi:hypothetical protein